MGRSLSFRLIYGVADTDESEGSLFDDDGDRAWDEALALKRGAVDPWGGFENRTYNGVGGNYQRWRDEEQARYNRWRKAPATVELFDAWNTATELAALDFPNIEIEYGGVEDWSLQVIGIKGSGFGSWGAVTLLLGTMNDGIEIEGEEAWDDEIRRFCEALEIDPDRINGPGWQAVINYG